jgi:hypothetical protein
VQPFVFIKFSVAHIYVLHSGIDFKRSDNMKATTVNFTGKVDRALLKRLKILAAKLATSINSLFNAELRHLVETYEAAEAHGNHNFQTLLDFSLGRISDIQAMEALSLDSEEDLFLLMARAHLPMPRLDAATTRKMAESLHALAR